VFRFAVDQKWLEESDIPFRTLRNAKASATGKRPAFTLVEWSRLEQKATDWINQPKLSGDNRRTRQLCWWFAVLCRAFALRAAEGYELRWRHVLDDVDQHSNPVVILAVPAVKNEKHERNVEPIFRFAPALREVLREKLPALYRIEYEREPQPDEPLFMHKDGLAIRSFFRGFESLLQFAGLLHDPHGNRFSLTSLRHSAITDEIENTDLNVGVIAVWAGTSVQMIDRHYNQALANRARRQERERRERLRSLAAV
jgi:integrase